MKKESREYIYGAKSSIGNTRMFTGREYDREIMLYFNRARYYDASIGRFISRDPIGINDDVNLYSYVGNSPVNAVDRMGLSSKGILATVGNLAADFAQFEWGYFVGTYYHVMDVSTAGILDRGGFGQNVKGTQLRQMMQSSNSAFSQGFTAGDDIGIIAEWGIGIYSMIGLADALIVNAPRVLGGAYKDIRNSNIGGEAHHIPANSVSPLSKDEGPAVFMTKEDHQLTASYGNSKEAQLYRETQKKLIDAGKFLDAVKMDIKDIQANFGNKYNEGIKQMFEYAKMISKKL